MTERITTPASRERPPTVAVLGAGIAGLTAAHELAERGFEVTVYESRPDERNGLASKTVGSHPPVKLGAWRHHNFPQWAPMTGAKPSCVLSQDVEASRAHPGELSRGNMVSASFPRSTYTSGTCSSASRSIS
ncbi:FAD-dependent oxidoreductase [Mycolicibacterium aichiense]|uniref:FAD-dependent oxidoreductase n=1 Tax=Mycolicibacterium aichiense TaxID=1799 RepID=UPI003D674618